jgi:hypothetical protein
MKVNMKKSDLKTGMVIRTKAGRKGMVLKSVIGNRSLIQYPDQWGDLDTYSDNLTAAVGEFDIVQVYQPTAEYQIAEFGWCDQELIWKRQEPKPMTIEEISEALGYPVKIVESKESAPAATDTDSGCK